MSEFWTNIPKNFTNEADVETRLVLPLLHALGYEPVDIAPKFPVTFQEGRVGRRPEADYVCFNGPLHVKDTSLVVVEAKARGEPLLDGKAQGESYAANLKAPLLLLTNGEQLELWQLQTTQESQRVLQADVQSLTASRGKIEAVLTKAAVVDYCRQFPTKNILEASLDFGRYENAELARTKRYAISIERTVRRGGTDETISTEKILAEFPTGCVIVASSGYGKTTLSNRLFRQSIEARWRNNSAPLSFDVPVPDLEETGLSALDFMSQRLSAHVPSATISALRDRVSDAGATIFFDGFDRASAAFQKSFETELANFRRDFPKAQVFVFSRESLRPSLALPQLTILPLSDVEKCALEAVILNDGSSQRFSIVWMMSPTLSEICEHPLLLQLVLDYWKREGGFPNQLAPLFHSWLESLLKVEPKAVVSAIEREKALTLIAIETRDTPIVSTGVITLLEKSGLAATLLDELVACDAVSMSGFTVEVQHEALADYLRAKDLASGSEAAVLATIQEVPMLAGSFFPVLLMAQLRTQRLQSALWRRMTEAGPQVYFDALRYRFDLSQELSKLDPAELSRQYLTELLAGIEQPLDALFPTLREAVVEGLTGGKGTYLAVTGSVSARPSNLFYQLHPRDNCDAGPVSVGVPSGPGIRRGMHLDLSRHRLDSARLVAIGLIKESVLDAVRLQALRGGVAWARERLIGRCRFLAETYEFPFTLDMNFDAVERVLAPHAREKVYPRALTHPERFAIAELFDDIATLRANGDASLDPWWLRLGWDNKSASQTDETICRVLDEHYRRTQVIYAEVVAGTFQAIADLLTFGTALPVRWQLTLVRRQAPDSGATVYSNWVPVAAWKDAGADVFFDRSPPKCDGLEDLSFRLAALGRPSNKIVRFDSFTPLADFDGRRWNGQFDGSTPAMHDVCSLLKDDLESIFSSMPSVDY